MPLACVPDPQLCFSPEASRHVMASFTTPHRHNLPVHQHGTPTRICCLRPCASPSLSHRVCTWIPSRGLLFCQCQHAFVVISLLTYVVPTYFLTLPRRLIIRSTFLRLNCRRFRFSPLPRRNAHGCKLVRLPAWTALSHPHCTR